MPANEKRRYVMTSDFRQYIAEYTVANFWRYPIRCRVTYASALESILSQIRRHHVTSLLIGWHLVLRSSQHLSFCANSTFFSIEKWINSMGITASNLSFGEANRPQWVDWAVKPQHKQTPFCVTVAKVLLHCVFFNLKITFVFETEDIYCEDEVACLQL